MSISIESPKQRVILFSHPRTASNLLVKLLSGQKGWAYDEYNFLPSYRYAIRNFDLTDTPKFPDDVWDRYSNLIAEGKASFDTFLSTARSEKKNAFVKEHAKMVIRPQILFLLLGVSPAPQISSPLPSETNPTIFSDAQMLTWTPLFCIRHPVLAFESGFRLRGEDWDQAFLDLYTSFQAQMKIYEWYQNYTNIIPVVVDADDLIDHPETVAKLCEILGMDASVVSWQWDAVPIFQVDEVKRRFMGTISDSTGVVKNKSSKRLDIGQKKKEWREEFGNEKGDWLARRMEDAMPDYKTLRSARVL